MALITKIVRYFKSLFVSFSRIIRLLKGLAVVSETSDTDPRKEENENNDGEEE